MRWQKEAQRLGLQQLLCKLFLDMSVTGLLPSWLCVGAVTSRPLLPAALHLNGSSVLVMLASCAIFPVTDVSGVYVVSCYQLATLPR